VSLFANRHLSTSHCLEAKRKDLITTVCVHGVGQRCAEADILASASEDFASASTGISRQVCVRMSVNVVRGTDVKYSSIDQC